MKQKHKKVVDRYLMETDIWHGILATFFEMLLFMGFFPRVPRHKRQFGFPKVLWLSPMMRCRYRSRDGKRSFKDVDQVERNNAALFHVYRSNRFSNIPYRDLSYRLNAERIGDLTLVALFGKRPHRNFCRRILKDLAQTQREHGINKIRPALRPR